MRDQGCPLCRVDSTQYTAISLDRGQMAIRVFFGGPCLQLRGFVTLPVARIENDFLQVAQLRGADSVAERTGLRRANEPAR